VRIQTLGPEALCHEQTSPWGRTFQIQHYANPQIPFWLRESHGFRSYYVLDGGEGVAVAVMVFEDRESAKAANDKEFVQASLLDLNLGDPEIIAGEVLVNIESDA
jgi:hypothetical protein